MIPFDEIEIEIEDDDEEEVEQEEDDGFDGPIEDPNDFSEAYLNGVEADYWLSVGFQGATR